jgi:hypothetical protein
MPRARARARKFATQRANVGDCAAAAMPQVQRLAAKAAALSRNDRRLKSSAEKGNGIRAMLAL